MSLGGEESPAMPLEPVLGGGSTRNLKEGRYQTKEQGSTIPNPSVLKRQGRPKPKLQVQSADAESWDQT